MRDDEAACQSDADRHDGFPHLRGDCLGQRRQDDEAEIAEDLDRDEEARDGHGDLLASLAEKLQEGERHALRGAGDLEQLPHHDAEADDDADAAERAAEPLGDARDDLLIADAADDADDDCRDDESEERTRSFLTASQTSRSDMWRVRKKTRRPSPRTSSADRGSATTRPGSPYVRCS